MNRYFILYHHYFYYLLSIAYYLLFISFSIFNFDPGKVAFLPNPTLIFIILLSTMILNSIAGYTENANRSWKWIGLRTISAVLTPMVGFLIGYRWYKKNKNNIRNDTITWGIYLLLLILLLQTLLFFILIVLLIILDPVPFHIYYIISVTVIWGQLGIISAEFVIKHINRDNTIINFLLVKRIYILIIFFIILLILIYLSPSNFQIIVLN